MRSTCVCTAHSHSRPPTAQQSVSLSVCLPACLPALLSVCPSVRLPVCPSACLFCLPSEPWPHNLPDRLLDSHAPTVSKPRRPARPAICSSWLCCNSAWPAPRRRESVEITVVRAGMLMPAASVSVANTNFSRPATRTGRHAVHIHCESIVHWHTYEDSATRALLRRCQRVN
jgi:hypothetical protein